MKHFKTYHASLTKTQLKAKVVINWPHVNTHRRINF